MLTPKAFDWLDDWQPRGTHGWRAGQADDRFNPLKRAVLVAATYSYDDRFSFLVSIPLMDEDDTHRIAYEHLWVVETLAMLSLAGHFFTAAGATLLDVEMSLQNLEGAVSWKASRGRAFTPEQPRVRDGYYIEQARFAARDRAAEPREATPRLFERLFASFLEPGDDIVADVARGR